MENIDLVDSKICSFLRQKILFQVMRLGLAVFFLVSCSGKTDTVAQSSVDANPTAMEFSTAVPCTPTISTLVEIKPDFHPPLISERMSPTQEYKSLCADPAVASFQFLSNAVDQHILSYSFVDFLHGWVTTETAVLSTQDGGETWQKIIDLNQFEISKFNSVVGLLEFISPQEWFGIQSRNIKHTQDGGKSWETLLNISPENFIHRFDFADRKHGWMTIENRGVRDLSRTTDGGKSWVHIDYPCSKVTFSSDLNFSFLNAFQGWMVCIDDRQKTTLFFTSDGGLHWEKLAESSASQDMKSGTPGWMPVVLYPYVISFADQNHGWITGNSSSQNPLEIGSLYATSDGGRTWRKVKQNGMQALFESPQLVDRDNGFILADHFGNIDGPALFKTRDGGRTWRQILPLLYPRQTTYLDSMNGFGVDSYAGVRQVFRTENGGRTWQKIGELPVSVETSRQIEFLDLQRGFELSQECNSSSCSNFGVFYTVDGGHKWQPFDQINGIAIRALDMVNHQEGYWIPFGNETLIQISLYGVEARKGAELKLSDQSVFQFLNLQVGYELTGGQLYKTGDGAKTWQPLQLPGCVNQIRILSLGRDGTIWVQGYQCSDHSHCTTLLLSSTDDGQNWKSVILPSVLQITNIQFVDANHGWLRGGNKTNYRGGITFGANHIYTTNDGGRTWVQMN